MSRPAVCAALALAGAVGAASAQVNRCVEPGGQVVYGDAACSTSGAARDGEAGRRLSGVAMERYPVRGTDAASLLADLRKRGPSGFHGFANWSVDYRYNFQPEGGRCRITSVRTSIKGRVLVPQWVDAADAPPALRADWQRYEAALIAHEEGHIAHGQSLVRALQRELGSLSTASCEQLRPQADALAARLIESHKALDRQYDARTQHGATQGARFEPVTPAPASGP